MDEESTTVVSDQETDSQTTDQQTDTTVDNLDTSTSTDTDTTDDSATTDVDTPAATLDADLDDWIAKRGLKAETDEEKQSLQELRNSQREFTREQQAKKEADASKELNASLKAERDALTTDEDEDDEDDELEKTVKELKADRDLERTTRLQSEFYTTNKVSDAEHKAIVDLIKEKVARHSTPEAKLAALDIWGSPDALPDLLDLAKARLFKSTDTSAAEEAAAKAERERIAKESNANSTTRGAKVTTTSGKTPEQERLDRFSSW